MKKQDIKNDKNQDFYQNDKNKKDTDYNKVLAEEKAYRTKLYKENKEQYKKERSTFIYGISQNFRKRNKDKRLEMKELDHETLEMIQGGEENE